MTKKTKNDPTSKKVAQPDKKKQAGVNVVGADDQLSDEQLEEVAGGLINSGDPDEGGELLIP
jgi:hypothetical protein